MNRVAQLICLSAAIVAKIACASEALALEAATRARPEVAWRADQTLDADVDCDGRKDTVLLGTTEAEVVVLVFRAGLATKPDSISFSVSRLNRSRVHMTVEALNVSDRDFQEMLGARPEGYRRSSRCKGIALTDGERDTTHLYWHKARREFGAWSP